MNNLPPKQIDELIEAVSLNADGKDQFIVNVFDDTIGYRLTKKARLATIARHIVKNYAASQLSAEYQLSQLAHESMDSLLGLLLQGRGRDSSSAAHPGDTPDACLALSTFNDLNLGNLALMNLADLQLERFAEKAYATGSLNVNQGEYVNGIVQSQGKITQLNSGKFSDAVPIDAQLDGASHHAVENSVIKAALDKKLNISDTSAYFAPTEGSYVAGLTQSNGKIIALHKYTLPKQPIDENLNANSANPVENRAVKKALDDLESRLSSAVDSKFVKLADANAYYKAPAGDFITSVRQVNGKLAGIETGNYDAKFAALEAKIAALQQKHDADIAALRQQIDAQYVKLSTSANQTITGPVTFNTKINGKITSADVSDASKWA